jgi:16S rRNA (uracil1498-N3)-methyltransferase
MIPRLYVAQNLQKGVRFQADERAAHYLLNVLRRGNGDPLLLFNGSGGEYRGRIAEAAKRRLVLEVLEQTRAQEEEPDLWLCFAPLKKDAVDFLVEKGTELGVGRFQPVLTAHSSSNRINQSRLTAVATEAAEQCERLTIPEVFEPISLEALRIGWGKDRQLLICAEAGEAAPIAQALTSLTSDVSSTHKFAILIGPEG